MAIDAGTGFVDILPSVNQTAFNASLRRQIEPALTRVGRSLSSAGRTLTRNISLPLIGAGVAAGKLALDFESAFTRISALSNASAEDIRRWRGEVLELAGETARAPQELAEALFFLASAGLRTSQIMPTLEASARASASGMGEVTDVAKITANALNAYAGSGLKAADVTDTLAAAIREGTAEPEEFAGALGRVLPIASKAEVEFDEVAASLASLSNIGLDVNEGVTAMRGLLQALVAPGSLAAETLRDVGVTARELRTSIADEGLLGALRLLEEATGGNIDKLRDIVPNIRALTGLFGLTTQEAEKVDAIFRNVADSTGDLDQAFGETSRGDAFRFQQQLNDLRVSAIRLGEKLIPVGQKIVEVISDLVEGFTDLSPATQETILKLGALAIVAGPILTIFGGLARITGGLVSVFRFLTAAAVPAAAAMGSQAVATTAASNAMKLYVANASGAVVATRSVGAAAGTAAVATGAGGLRGALVALGNPAVQASLGLVAGLLLTVKAAADDSERKIRETVQALRSGATTVEEVQERIATSQRQLENVPGTVQGAGAAGAASATRRAIDEQTEALQRYRSAQEQLVRSTRFTNTEAAQWTKTLLKNNELSQRQSRQLVTLSSSIDNLGGRLSEQERRWVDNLIAAGDYSGAVDLLKERLDKVEGRYIARVDVRVTGAAAVLALQNQLRSLPGNTGVEVRGSGQIRGPAALGGIIAGQSGFITRGPTFLTGEGRYATPFGRGAEGVIPFGQHGIRILSQALRLAIEQGRTGGDGGDIIGELRAIRRLLNGLELRLDGERVGRAVSRQQRRNQALAGDA